MIRKYAEIFCWKNVSRFCSAKATHIFSAKNIRILYIESAKTVNEMTLNELVKLTTLWTIGPNWAQILKNPYMKITNPYDDQYLPDSIWGHALSYLTNCCHDLFTNTFSYTFSNTDSYSFSKTPASPRHLQVWWRFDEKWNRYRPDNIFPIVCLCETKGQVNLIWIVWSGPKSNSSKML